MRPFLHGAKEHIGMQQQQASLAVVRLTCRYSRLSCLPHLGTALLAHLPQIFARRCHARQNRRGIRPVERKHTGERFGVDT